jgi:hypothetical protein
MSNATKKPFLGLAEVDLYPIGPPLPPPTATTTATTTATLEASVADHVFNGICIVYIRLFRDTP